MCRAIGQWRKTYAKRVLSELVKFTHVTRVRQPPRRVGKLERTYQMPGDASRVRVEPPPAGGDGPPGPIAEPDQGVGVGVVGQAEHAEHDHAGIKGVDPET